MNVKHIAMVCHEANRAYCATIGDHSQLPWDIAPKWQQDSAVNGVQARLDNPDAPPSASHENWLRHKLDSGWRYGPVKDEHMKTHPCIVPYAMLPAEQRKKDAIFTAIVDALKDDE